MSDIEGGQDLQAVRQQFRNNDFVQIPYTAAQDYYIIGLMAYLSDPTVFATPPLGDWGILTHGQPTPPTFLAAILPVWPAAMAVQVPTVRGKYVLFRSTTDCWIRFEGPLRVQHLIPANTWVRYRQLFNIIYVVRSTADGILTMMIEG